MDGILICLETAGQDLMTKDSSIHDDSANLKFSAEFAEVLKETLELEVREINNPGFGLHTMNREERNSVQKTETEGNGLLMRRKLSLASEPRDNFPAEIGPPARRASFPAIGSSEVIFSLNGTKANSYPDNWMPSLLNDLPSIKEVPEERIVADTRSSKFAKQERTKTCARSLTTSRNTTPRTVNENPRRFISARFSNTRTKATKFKNSPRKNKVVMDKSTNWKIRVHKKTIIDDDSDDDTSTHSSISGLFSRSASWSGDSTSRFPTIDLPAKKHSY